MKPIFIFDFKGKGATLLDEIEQVNTLSGQKRKYNFIPRRQVMLLGCRIENSINWMPLALKFMVLRQIMSN